jgi:hypothetical protein
MTTARIDWTTALAPGARVVPVILIAGLPAVLTPAGVLPTTVAVSSGTIDALWWPGTGALAELLPGGDTLQPVEDLLDPTETLEVFERASLLKGDVRVESLSFSVLDTDGRGTTLLSNREGRITQLLASDITATANTIPLVSSVGFPASGIACIERETVTYITVTGTNLTTVQRGKYGSHARAHLSPAEHRPLVVAGYPRHWQSRLATVWLCVLSADGLTLTDPSLLYAGTVGAGVQMTGNLSRWTVPLDHVSVALTRKVDIPPVSIYGYHHFSAPSTARAFGGEHPLSIVAGNTSPPSAIECSLLWDPASVYDRGGWHPTREAFVSDCNAKVAALAPGANVFIDGALRVSHSGTNANNSTVRFSPGWGNNAFEQLGGNANDDNSPAVYTAADMPEAYFKMSDGIVRIPSTLDFARIPTTFQWTATTSDGVTGNAFVALTADTVGQKGYTTSIVARNDPPQTVTLARLSVIGGADVDTRVFERTAVKLGVVATGESPIAALKAAALAIDALTGQDLFESAVDWDHLERLFMAPTSSLPQAREYRFTGDTDSFLDVLIDELRLRGMCMVIRYGLISAARLMSYADSEDTSAAIVETDTLSEDGKEIPIEIVDNIEPLATGVDYSFPAVGDGDPIVISITDLTYQSEFGDSARVECKALLSIPTASAPNLGASLIPLYAVAQQILGPLAEPSRAVRIPLTPVLLGLQPGDLTKFTHSRIPMWTGVRGITDGVCQVQEVRRILFGGRLRATMVLRLQSAPAFGYAPEAIVESGGLTSGGTTVQISTATAWGPTCHARDTTASGAASTSAVDGFEVGDVVVLSQISTRSPIADVQRTLTAVDPVLNTVTLSSAPGATMAGAAGVYYGVILRYAPYDQCTARQQRLFAWIADQTTQVLGAADAPKRYTA